MIRVVLAEDTYLVREGIQRLLEPEPDIELAAACADLPSLLEAIETERPEEMAQGKNNAAIAASLVITERSVEKVIHAIFQKLGVSWQPDVNRRVKAVLLYLAEREN